MRAQSLKKIDQSEAGKNTTLSPVSDVTTKHHNLVKERCGKNRNKTSNKTKDHGMKDRT